jgi:hypothetical protein
LHARPAHHEVLENKAAIATLKRAATTSASYLSIDGGLIFDTHQFVLRPTHRTIERRNRSFCRHAARLIASLTMPRKSPKLIEVEQRVAHAREVVATQSKVLERLKAERKPTHDAERALAIYRSSLKHLEMYAESLRPSPSSRRRDQRE